MKLISNLKHVRNILLSCQGYNEIELRSSKASLTTNLGGRKPITYIKSTKKLDVKHIDGYFQVGHIHVQYHDKQAQKINCQLRFNT